MVATPSSTCGRGPRTAESRGNAGVPPLPNTDAAMAGRRDENVFLRKVRVGRALEEAQREGATEVMMEKEAGESKKLEAGKIRERLSPQTVNKKWEEYIQGLIKS